MTGRQGCIEIAQRHLDRQGLHGRIEESAVGRSLFSIADGAVVVSLRGPVDEGLHARGIRGGAEEKPISTV